MPYTGYKEITCRTLEDGRVRYWCSTPVNWKEDGWGTAYYRTTVPVPAGTSLEAAAEQSEAFRLTEGELSRRRYDEHLDFSCHGKRSFAHNVYHFEDGSEAICAIHHPRHDR